jgi:hypothetical protein
MLVMMLAVASTFLAAARADHTSPGEIPIIATYTWPNGATLSTAATRAEFWSYSLVLSLFFSLSLTLSL